MKADIRKGLIAFALFMPVSMIYAASGTELMAVEDAYLPHAERASLEELDGATGREGIDVTTLNNMNVRALLSGNTATNNASGFNMIDSGSFAGSGGMFSVIQNSGNNVLIQDSTIINVTILP
ncbi:MULTISPECIES: hypothetical protein [Nitrosomonas]|uniref:Carbon storage regulator n=2 Tax=Nitrosomonas eutropha TaxID=916 RepID=A0ABX5M5L4_9PROT|nr:MULTISPECIES: hypothetical protein [Nitrosomonas]ABI59341.1 conserved hypothetical protein [Nitrosomonas eutropha C91]PXV79749.1 hypothetical protein C8R14_12112 [Nitrosomonas eutropha]SCX25831.1 hypothetical protein SAMN05216379_12911 [Nitrosomonas eutropha]SDW87604.1 hypothetical protein SAMN05216317_11636 [Nitrosomonas eutropha]SEI39045.1 hypothetical protein SAMN05216318_101147 [Nitrosomonas eutropha]